MQFHSRINIGFYIKLFADTIIHIYPTTFRFKRKGDTIVRDHITNIES